MAGAAHPARGKESRMKCVRTEEEVARVENWAVAGIDGGTRYPGMSYEQGIVDALEWIRGDSDTAPDEG